MEPDRLRAVVGRIAIGDVVGAASGILAFVVLGVSETVQGCLACRASLTDPAEEIARAVRETRGGIRAGAYLALLGAFLLIAFAGYLRRELRRAEGEGGWLASVAYGGGLVAAAVALVRASFDLAAAAAAEFGGDPAVATVYYALRFEFYFLFAAPMAALVAAASAIALRFGALPRWLGWLGLPVTLFALAPLLPGAAAFVTFLWASAASLVLARRALRAPGSRAPS